ncbi:MAG: hypothetical protein KF729_00215 [Sandaracinaceae bacterium]|nr:hypothetical protein [Sandaracinaceae bacterium]
MRRAAALALVASGCTLVVDLPSAAPEESPRACMNGIDDDLDGEVDCADPSCRAFCWSESRLTPPSVEDCFVDAAHGLAFRVVTTAGTNTRCEPDPDETPPCEGGAHRPPGAASCRTPGTDCPEGDWPAPIDDGRATLHVRAGASGGDGSAGAPFGTLAEALAAAPDGARVVLARGAHDAPPPIERALELRGACANETTILGAVAVRAPGVALADLSLVGPEDEPALDAGADTALAGVAVEGAVLVRGALLEAEDTKFTHAGGLAITAREGARVRVVASTITAASGVDAEASALTLSGVRVAGSTGRGLRLGPGARTDGAAGVVVDPVRGTAVELACDAGEVRCADFDALVVRFPRGLPTSGRGVLVRSGRVRLRRAYVARSFEPALDVEGGAVDLEDGTIESSEGGAARVGSGGRLVLLRTYLHHNRQFALRAEAGSEINGINVGMVGGPLNGGDVCVEAAPGSQLWLTRFLTEQCRLCGVRVERDVDLSLRDGVIAGNMIGLCAVEGASYPVSDLTSSVAYRDNGANLAPIRR